MRPRASALATLFARFVAMRAERGFLAMGWQIVGATVVEARRPRLRFTTAEQRRSSGSRGQIELELQRLCRLPEDARALPYDWPLMGAITG